MGFRPFMETSNKPTEETINNALGSIYSYYQDLINLAKSFSQEWTYAKSSGWMLKIFNRKKSLMYIIPLREKFIVSLAIRENEREVILKNKELEGLHNELTHSRKQAEGYALKYEVTNDKEYKQVKLLVEQILIFRS